MAILVQKYGGSSVADEHKIAKVAERVVAAKLRGYDVVVVVSAMGKTTDGLIAQARQVSPTPPQRELDMLVTAGERISMALLSMAIHEAGGDSISFTGSQSGIITEDSHQGARIIEGYPIEPTMEKTPDPFVWLGLPSAFRRAGFKEVARRSPTRPIVRRVIQR